VFDVRKPYFNLDDQQVFTLLGNVEHRGVEASISGQLTRRLDIVAGGVFMRPRVTGEGVVLGRVGPKPVGQPARNLQLNLDWRPPGVGPLSLDAGVTHISQRPATRDNRVELPARTLVDLGARYTFKTDGREASLRLRVTNLFNVHGWDLRGAGADDLIAGRVGSIALAVDF
jgi:iron complex outermembrane receptor protein